MNPTMRGALGCGACIAVVVAALGAAAGARADDGWTYLIDKLVADGVPRARAERVFADRRVPPFDGLGFSLSPRESHARYRWFLRPASVALARACRRRHAEAFEAAEREYGVPASTLAALLHVETACGRNTGSSLVFHRLARLAMANEPANVRMNIARLAGPDPDPAVVERVRARARYLEDTFYPEVRALFEIAERLDIDPLDIRGSESGAFGYPQFLPTNYLEDGVDADGDGRVSLYDHADAVASCAKYLVRHGWKPGMTRAERRAVIWQYNRSDAYVDTVLALAERIAAPAPPPVRRATKSTRRRRTATKAHTKRAAPAPDRRAAR
jgi:membrane-bound lytic murein transglycosylase B